MQSSLHKLQNKEYTVSQINIFSMTRPFTNSYKACIHHILVHIGFLQKLKILTKGLLSKAKQQSPLTFTHIFRFVFAVITQMTLLQF